MSRPRIPVPLLAITLLAALAPAGAQQPSAAPAPDSPGIHVSSSLLARELRAALAQHKDPAVAAIGATGQYQIHEVRRSEAAGPPAIHHGWTELHFILSGGGTLVTGGRIEHGAIVGGTSERVRKGDAVIIAPQTPHWYSKIDRGGLTYLEVRFPTPAGAGSSPARRQ